MIDLRVEYMGGGKFQTLTPTDYEEAERSLTRGDKVRAQLTHQRSVRQNAYFHALVQCAYENQRGGNKLPSWRHLRSHLLIAAGHCHEERVSLNGVPDKLVTPLLQNTARVLRRHSDLLEISLDRKSNDVVFRAAKSWSFRETNSDVASAVLNKVIAHICSEIVPNLDPTRLTREAKARVSSKPEEEAV